MLDTDEHSGIITFLGGIVVLVLVAVGFSLILDKRFRFSSGREQMRTEIGLQADELKELAWRHEHQSTLLAKSSFTRKGASEENNDLNRRVEALRKQEEILRGKKAGLESDLETLGADFSRYRAAYRAKTWSRAVGEKLGDITVRGGREYKDSQITKVTDVGLEIRHEHGIARIQAPDLSVAMQDRFQWNDEERRRLLKDEDRNLHGNPEESSADQEAGDSTQVADALSDAEMRRAARLAERERIRGYREKVRAWKLKVSQLAAERSEAHMNAYGNSNSVPGSLETWKEKSARLSKELGKAQGELAKARSRLSAVAPSDPELKRESQR